MERIVEADHFNVVITDDENQIEIEFGDGYQQDLLDVYGWSQTDVDGVDEVIRRKLNEIGCDSEVCWEDRELFVIENVGEGNLDTLVVAKLIHELIPNSRILEGD